MPDNLLHRYRISSIKYLNEGSGDLMLSDSESQLGSTSNEIEVMHQDEYESYPSMSTVKLFHDFDGQKCKATQSLPQEGL